MAHRGQIKTREGSAIYDSAFGKNPAPRRRERLVAGGHAGKFQREVTLDGGREIAFAAAIERPASVGALRIEQIFFQARFELEINRVHEMIEDDELGVHLRVRFERRVPVALGLLQRDERTLSAIDRVINFAGKLVAGRNRERRTVYFNCLSHISPVMESPRT